MMASGCLFTLAACETVMSFGVCVFLLLGVARSAVAVDQVPLDSRVDAGASMSSTRSCDQILITSSHHLWQIHSLHHKVSHNQNDTDACWTVMVAATTGNYCISVRDLHFQLHSGNAGSSNCSSHLEMRDGCSAMSPLLGRYCQKPALMVTTSACMYLHYRGSGTTVMKPASDKGFSLQLQVFTKPRRGVVPLNGDATCTLLSLDMPSTLYYLHSPGYPRHYTSDTDSCVILHVSETLQQRASGRYHVLLHVLDSRLQQSYQCRKDYVIVRDGISRVDKYLLKWCGVIIPHNITSCGSALHVQFHTDSSETYPGFNAVFRAVRPQPRHDITRCKPGHGTRDNSTTIGLIVAFVCVVIVSLCLCTVFCRKYVVRNYYSDEYQLEYFADDSSDDLFSS